MEKGFLRTFIALPVEPGPETLKVRNALIESLSSERISWVDPGRFHVTLRFLGDTPVAAIDKIGRALDRRLSLPVSTTSRITRLGSFGPKRKPRVIWMGFEEMDWMVRLKTEVDQALVSCGIFHEEQPFKAHLTLGRIRGMKNISGFYRVMGAYRERLAESVTFNRLVFYESQPGRTGPVYTPLKRMEFGSAG